MQRQASAFGETERFQVRGAALLPDYSRKEVGAGSFYTGNATFSSNADSISIVVSAPFWLIGLQLTVEIPNFINYGAMKAWVLRPDAAAGTIDPNAVTATASNILLMAATGVLGTSTAGLSGGTFGQSVWQAPDLGGFPGAFLCQAGQKLIVHHDYTGYIATANVPGANTSKAFVNLITHTVPYVDLQGKSATPNLRSVIFGS